MEKRLSYFDLAENDYQFLLKEREYKKTPVDQEEPEMIQEKDFSCEPLKPEKKKSRSR